MADRTEQRVRYGVREGVIADIVADNYGSSVFVMWDDGTKTEFLSANFVDGPHIEDLETL